MEFKEQVEADVVDVFLNTEEFARDHIVNGKKITCMVDDNEMLDRQKGKDNKDYRDGTYVKQVMLYVGAVFFGAKPGIGRALKLDGRNYMVKEVVDEGGVYAITLEVMKA